MQSFLKTAFLSAGVLAISAGATRAESTITILHFNDLHSRIEPINAFDSTCSQEDAAENKCFGGIARLKTAIDTRRAAAGGNVLVLSAGDNFQGSLFYTTYKGETEAEFLEQMGLDAMVVGNHEFDDGEPALKAFADKVSFPILGANLDLSDDSTLSGNVEPYIIKEIDGEKYGIIGVVAADTGELSSPGDKIAFTDPVETVRAQVSALEAEGVNKIIVLSHIGYVADRRIAEDVEGVDLVVGGHSNTLLSDTDDEAVDAYPALVETGDGTKVPVVQAYAYGKFLGEITLRFDDAGKVIEADGEPVLIDSSIEPDQAFTDRITELAAPIEELKQQKVAETSAMIEGSRDVCRAAECSMGNLVADAMLDRVTDQGISIAIQNGGGLRASIDSGEITMGEVITVLPFQNTISTFQLKGSDVVAALENGVSQLEEGAGRFAQVSGITYSFDPAKPAGERIQSVKVRKGESFVDIDPDATYGVVSNNYMRGGGDGYDVFAENGTEAYDFGPSLENVVADYLVEKNPYTPYTDGRIANVAAASAEPADTGDTGETVPVPEPVEEAETIATTPPEVAPESATSEAEAPAANTTPEEYVVKAGDTLGGIAGKVYGNSSMWEKISEANDGVSPGNLKIGRTLVIPK